VQLQYRRYGAYILIGEFGFRIFAELYHLVLTDMFIQAGKNIPRQIILMCDKIFAPFFIKKQIADVDCLGYLALCAGRILACIYRCACFHRGRYIRRGRIASVISASCQVHQHQYCQEYPNNSFDRYVPHVFLLR